MDEQSFQSLLSAAYTIQEHNERRKLELLQAELATTEHATDDVAQCPRCGAAKTIDESGCETCGLDKLRPGERMQRNWASMWLMSQEQGLWPERPTNDDLSASNFLAAPIARKPAGDDGDSAPETENPKQIQRRDRSMPAVPSAAAFRENFLDENFLSDNSDREDAALETLGQETLSRDQIEGEPDSDRKLPVSDLQTLRTNNRLTIVESFPVDSDYVDSGLESDGVDSHEVDSGKEEHAKTIQVLSSAADEPPRTPAARDLRLAHFSWASASAMWRQHRADLYLGAAIFVAVLALLWPSANAPKRSDLSLWDKTLIGMGIAEAPAPVAHLPGDPSVQVWIDPHTALYYCQGDDLYGKAANGRFSTQREAQMDRFEPASRAACE